MTDPMTPLTEEATVLLNVVAAGRRIDPEWVMEQLVAIEQAAGRRAIEGSGVVEALESIRDYQPTEVTYDDFAYARMVKSYQRAARQALAALPRPEEPRVVRCEHQYGFWGQALTPDSDLRWCYKCGETQPPEAR